MNEDLILITVYMNRNTYETLGSLSRISRMHRSEIIRNAVSMLPDDFGNEDMAYSRDRDNEVMTSAFLDVIQDSRLREMSFRYQVTKSSLINVAVKSYLVSQEMKSLITSPRPMPSSQVLDLPMNKDDARTVREYLSEILLSVWQEDRSFDYGKHRQELYRALINGGACSAEQNGHGKITDAGDAETVVSNAIKAMARNEEPLSE